MVGIPGRSQACHTCRKRKKGCDLQRPTRGQCQKLRLKCDGYTRQLYFIHTTQQKLAPRPSTPEIALPETLAHSAYQTKYLGLFWETYLPGSRSLSSESESVQGILGGWSNTIQDLYLIDDVLRKALLAMCLGTIGRRDGEKWMTEQGLRLYVGALREMSAVLLVPSKAKCDTLLTASKLFSLYEAMYGADDRDRLAQAKSWLAHCAGEKALLIAREPEGYINGHTHRLFVDGRLHLTISAIIARKRCILSSDEWKAIPWQQHKKTLKDTSLDILVDLPSLFEDLDSMKSCNDPEEKEFRCQILIDDCWLFDARLAEWYQNIPLPREHALPSPSTFTTIKPQDLALTHILTLYWTTCLILYSTLPLLSPQTPLPPHTNPKIYCRYIIKALPIFLHPSVGTFRVHLATFPMGAVLRYLPREMEVEKKLLRGYFGRKEANTMRSFVNGIELEALEE